MDKKVTEPRNSLRYLRLRPNVLLQFEIVCTILFKNMEDCITNFIFTIQRGVFRCCINYDTSMLNKRMNTHFLLYKTNQIIISANKGMD